MTYKAQIKGSRIEPSRSYGPIGSVQRSDQWSLDAGRCIVKNGIPLATIHGAGNYDPTEVDALARLIVSMLQIRAEARATESD